MADTRTLSERLAEPFPAASLGWKPQSVKNNRALAVAYIDARDVMDRLDAVCGPENWQDEFLPLPDGQVVCRLSVRINGEWIVKSDVGGESEQPDADDRKKAAFSDALKRAAIHWGIGRYLYAMPSQWCDYDPVKKQFVQVPQIAAKFLPRPVNGKAPEQPKQPAPAAAATPAAQTQKPSAPKPAQTDDPVHNLDALHALFKSKGKNWNAAIAWLSQHTGTGYDPQKTAWLADVPEDHRKILVEAVRKMPSPQPQQKAG